MIIRRYINGKKVDVEVNTTPAPPAPTPLAPTELQNIPQTAYNPPPPPAPPRRKGCGCGRK